MLSNEHQKWKLQNKFIYNSNKKHEILWNKHNRVRARNDIWRTIKTADTLKKT